jgi:hypothetical protein
MKLYCPECGQRISADYINLARACAKCAKCDILFGFGSALQDDRRRIPGSIVPARQPANAYRPPQMHLQDFAGTLSIHWRWFDASIVFMTFFCIAWDSFLYFWYKIAFTQREILAIIFPLLHVAVGVGLTYATLCGYLNSTTIRATTSSLKIRNGPLPWEGNRLLLRKDIETLYCSSRMEKDGQRWDLYAVLSGGKKLKLIGGLKERVEAQFLQREIEDRMQIATHPLAAENAA